MEAKNLAYEQGVAWMERGGIQEERTENPGLYPGYRSATAMLLMNKSVVLRVTWMERSGIREVGAGNPGLHPGYGSVLVRLD